MDVIISYKGREYTLADPALNTLDRIDKVRAYYKQTDLLAAWGRAPTRFVYQQPVTVGEYYFDNIRFENGLFSETRTYTPAQLLNVRRLSTALIPLENELQMRAYFGYYWVRKDNATACFFGMASIDQVRTSATGFTGIELYILDDRVEMGKKHYPLTSDEQIPELITRLRQALLTDEHYNAWRYKSQITVPPAFWQTTGLDRRSDVTDQLAQTIGYLDAILRSAGIDRSIPWLEQMRLLHDMIVLRPGADGAKAVGEHLADLQQM